LKVLDIQLSSQRSRKFRVFTISVLAVILLAHFVARYPGSQQSLNLDQAVVV
jgi:hypothetical protein